MLVFISLILIIGCSANGFNTVARESLARAYPMPERIILNLTQTPAASQAVTWRTRAVVANPRAEIARATGSCDFRTRAVTVTALTETVKLDNNTSVFSLSVIFKDLTPGTTYAYRVGDDNTWSEWNQFKTAESGSTPFTFVYFGDPQEEVKSMCPRTFRSAFKKEPYASFWHFVGDLVDNGDRDEEWEEFYYALGFIPRTIPMIALPGNHEYPDRRFIQGDAFRIFSLWRPQFTLPENGPRGLEETAYFIDYQGVRFIMLNGNERLEEQAKWLEGVLADNPQPWTIAAIHQPIYSTGKKRKDLHRQEVFVPIFDRFAVDLVLQGHDHTYARTKRLFNGQPSLNKSRGTVYVTSVSGPKSYPVNHHHDNLMEVTETGLQLFQVIRVDGDTLTFESFDATGNLHDRFQLKK